MSEPAAAEGTQATSARSWLEPESRSRRLLFAFAIYVACLVVFGLMAGDRLSTHTPYNHFAHLADAWLHGRQDLRRFGLVVTLEQFGADRVGVDRLHEAGRG